MTIDDEIAYYRRREAQERRAQDDAIDCSAAAVHGRLARLYADRAATLEAERHRSHRSLFGRGAPALRIAG